MANVSRLPQLIIDLSKIHLNLAILSICLGVSTSFLEVVSTSLVMPLLQFLGSDNVVDSHVKLPVVLQEVIKVYDHLSNPWKLLAVVLSFVGITIVKNFNKYLALININKLQLKVGLSLREKCTERLLELDILFFNQAKVGELLSYINEHIQRSEILVSRALELVDDILNIFFLLILLISISGSLTLVAILGLTVTFLLLKPLIKLVKIYGQKTVKYIENFSVVLTEIISGITVIKEFNAEKRELEKAKKVLQKRYEVELTGFKYSSAVVPITEILGITLLLTLLTIGSISFANHSGTTTPILLTYTFALLKILPRISHLNNIRSQISLFGGSLEAVQHFLSSTEDQHLPEGNLVHKFIKEKLVFENVIFSFPTKSKPALNKLNLQIDKGTTTAIVGASGSGKSTLVKLIMRFYDPNQGSIKVDGVDLREFQIVSWRCSIAIVSQDTFLFHGSIKENIAYGCPEASKAEIIEAAKKAYAYEFIQELPEGFDTVVGNRGTKLSGGQRQRIAIARAILREPDILILDEATSALDANSERIVQKAIEDVSRDRTVIVIAHRLSTVEKADKIIVLNQGAVVEQGTHQELLKQKGEYWSLYNSQVTYAHSINH
jgi:ABC-type multidrug transport system fused ATPase/permease subunit